MRKLRGHTFFVVPSNVRIRWRRAPRWLTVVGGLVIIGCAVFVGILIADTGQRETAASLRAENAGLRDQISRLEQKMALLRADLEATYHLQETVATAVGMRSLDPAVREAGVGGRAVASPVVLGGVGPADRARVAALDQGIDKLLRQARIQTQAYQSILDTLQARTAARGRIPSIRPVEGGWLSSGFGARVDPFTGNPAIHQGLDFSVSVGTPVHATADGVVREVLFERGFGHVIVVQHDARTATRYAHLSKTAVQRGSRVGRGDVIGFSGASGRVTSPHLHYEILLDGQAVNPLPYILEPYAWRR